MTVAVDSDGLIAPSRNSDSQNLFGLLLPHRNGDRLNTRPEPDCDLESDPADWARIGRDLSGSCKRSPTV